MLDLNIETWYRLGGQDGSIKHMLAFMRGENGRFYDEGRYERELGAWALAKERVEKYLDDADRYLKTGVPTAELGGLLDFQRERVMENDPKLICFSVMYPKQLVFALALSAYLRSLPDLPEMKIVLGGAMFSFVNGRELLFACPEIDGLVQGEGEEAALQLTTGEPLNRIQGMLYRDGDSVRLNPKPDTVSLHALPAPDFRPFHPARYLAPEPVLPMLFSRGCRWRKCRFCAHNLGFSGYRSVRVARLVDTIEAYNDIFGARCFYFADQYIGIGDLMRIAGEIKKRRLAVYFHYMGQPVGEYNRETFETLFEAGCRWISWGVESGSQRLLDLINKGTNVEGIARVIADSHDAGIRNIAMMIFGLPSSTDEEFNRTVDFLSCLSGSIDIVTASSFSLYRGTGFARQAPTFGIEITGARPLFETARGIVHGLKLDYREADGNGTGRPPRGPVETAAWERKKEWIFEPSIPSRMCAEHYLLYAVRTARSVYPEAELVP
ncbi:MAG: radical SAM protein [Spirochaetes bacterium]|nr:radical SAM protein [Spirochaetota bacterium]